MKQLFLSLLMLLAVGFTTDAISAEKRAKEPKNGTAEKPLKVEVSTLNDLMPYLRKDYVELKMAPGVYRISVSDIKSGKFTKGFEISEGRLTYALLPVEGNNSVYDFTGVTVEVETGVANAFTGRYFEMSELHIFGNNNVIKGIKIENVGSVHDFPKCAWVNVIMDGSSNRIEGAEIISRGSKPYGYGEVFGKGRINTIAHKKHCGWLIRGDSNHVKDCRIIHRCYGHYMFMQGVSGKTIIEGCYIEGEMVSTDKILGEKGTGSPADKIGFKTCFEYTLPSGYTLSTGEDGIRTYGEGTTLINGERIKRNTGGDIIIRNCTVKHARSGISLTLGGGTRLVENCTLIGCQDGFSVGNNGKIINCRADAAFGPAIRFVSNRDRDAEIDVTIIPYEGNKLSGNGSKHLVHLFGSGHKITLRKGEGLKLEDDMKIAIGGDSYTIGNLAKQENYIGNSITLINETGYPITLDDNTKDCKITTNGEVTNEGTNNTVTKK